MLSFDQPRGPSKNPLTGIQSCFLYLSDISIGECNEMQQYDAIKLYHTRELFT